MTSSGGAGTTACSSPWPCSFEATVFLFASLIVERDRPPVEQLDSIPPSGSFPSGHTAAAVAFYGGCSSSCAGTPRNRAVRTVFVVVAIVTPRDRRHVAGLPRHAPPDRRDRRRAARPRLDLRRARRPAGRRRDIDRDAAAGERSAPDHVSRPRPVAGRRPASCTPLTTSQPRTPHARDSRSKETDDRHGRRPHHGSQATSRTVWPASTPRSSRSPASAGSPRVSSTSCSVSSPCRSRCRAPARRRRDGRRPGQPDRGGGACRRVDVGGARCCGSSPSASCSTSAGVSSRSCCRPRTAPRRGSPGPATASARSPTRCSRGRRSRSPAGRRAQDGGGQEDAQVEHFTRASWSVRPAAGWSASIGVGIDRRRSCSSSSGR